MKKSNITEIFTSIPRVINSLRDGCFVSGAFVFEDTDHGTLFKLLSIHGKTIPAPLSITHSKFTRYPYKVASSSYFNMNLLNCEYRKCSAHKHAKKACVIKFYPFQHIQTGKKYVYVKYESDETLSLSHIKSACKSFLNPDSSSVMNRCETTTLHNNSTKVIWDRKFRNAFLFNCAGRKYKIHNKSIEKWHEFNKGGEVFVCKETWMYKLECGLSSMPVKLKIGNKGGLYYESTNDQGKKQKIYIK